MKKTILIFLAVLLIISGNSFADTPNVELEMDNNYNPPGMLAVYIETKETDTLWEKTTYYSDGSKSVIGVDISEAIITEYDPEEIGPLGVDPGTGSGGTGYRNYQGARVYFESLAVRGQFYADFSLVNRGNDSITRIYNYSISIAGGTYDLEYFEVIQAVEGYYPASAELRWQANRVGYFGYTCRLTLHVGNDSFWETHFFDDGIVYP